MDIEFSFDLTIQFTRSYFICVYELRWIVFSFMLDDVIIIGKARQILQFLHFKLRMTISVENAIRVLGFHISNFVEMLRWTSFEEARRLDWKNLQKF